MIKSFIVIDYVYARDRVELKLDPKNGFASLVFTIGGRERSVFPIPPSALLKLRSWINENIDEGGTAIRSAS